MGFVNDMFGWDYADSWRCCVEHRGLFAYAVSEKFPRRFVGFEKCRDDQDYAFDFVRTLKEIDGGEIYLEEFNPAIHVPGYVPERCKVGGYTVKEMTPAAPPAPPTPPPVPGQDKPT